MDNEHSEHSGREEMKAREKTRKEAHTKSSRVVEEGRGERNGERRQQAVRSYVMMNEAMHWYWWVSVKKVFIRTYFVA